jgi:hypothetical protein
MARRSRSANPAAADRSLSSSICGHGRSGLTWSGVTGETPPQSSMPARSRRSYSPAMRFGGAWMRARDGDRRGEVGELRVGHAAHGGIGLGAEVLDDGFLDVPVLAGDTADREERVGALGKRLADADQDAGGERNPDPAGVFQHPEPHGWFLVGRAVVRAALLAPQAGRGGLQHHAHAGGDRLQPLEVGPGKDAGVEVREKAGLFEYRDGARPHIVQCGLVAALVEPLAGGGPPLLGPVAEREERFLAAVCRAGAGDVEHLVAFEERGRQPVRHGRERAVVAAVAAEPGERDEDVLGERDDARAACVAQPRVADRARDGEQFVEGLAASGQQGGGLVDV